MWSNRYIVTLGNQQRRSISFLRNSIKAENDSSTTNQGGRELLNLLNYLNTKR